MSVNLIGTTPLSTSGLQHSTNYVISITKLIRKPQRNEFYRCSCFIAYFQHAVKE